MAGFTAAVATAHIPASIAVETILLMVLLL